jgi:hypothetical protein
MYGQKGCSALEEPVCKERSCSFYETTEEFLARNRRFHQKKQARMGRIHNIDTYSANFRESERSMQESPFAVRFSARRSVRNRPVICIDTGVVYKTAKHACSQCGISMNNLHKHLAGKSKTCGGNVWQYADLG